MPYLTKPRVKHRMAAAGFADAKQLAEAVPSMRYGSLRNAVGGSDPINLTYVYDIARALILPGEELQDVVADILLADDSTSSETTKQPTGGVAA